MRSPAVLSCALALLLVVSVRASASPSVSLAVTATLEYRLWLRSGPAEAKAPDWEVPAVLEFDHVGGPVPTEVASNVLEWELSVECGSRTTVSGGFTSWAYQPVLPGVECPPGPVRLSLKAGAWRR